MSWLLLIFAGLLETVWAIGLKYTEGFTRLGPSVVTLIAMAISITLLAFAMRELPVGTAYAVWTGIGVVGTVIIGMMWLGEPVQWVRIVSLAMIVLGIVGLKLTH
ncbi:quaternary ammonium compound efflux SMR transporter SugE [Acerihabitans arboris]|uniref:Guanidinium exporter n=1 Tax=Acerihabitans arboris TaxID=2691583 RepID=A0A845SEE9_9GAMM|nr:quaternary ammonium compound efflux SMR transporter SugE [Acerihabitans arboris]NDL61456.1 quaternary ammonium compound efflux SMR transporter SugE [Acerihabitans arboris]